MKVTRQRWNIKADGSKGDDLDPEEWEDLGRSDKEGRIWVKIGGTPGDAASTIFHETMHGVITEGTEAQNEIQIRFLEEWFRMRHDLPEYWPRCNMDVGCVRVCIPDLVKIAWAVYREPAYNPRLTQIDAQGRSKTIGYGRKRYEPVPAGGWRIPAEEWRRELLRILP